MATTCQCLYSEVCWHKRRGDSLSVFNPISRVTQKIYVSWNPWTSTHLLLFFLSGSASRIRSAEIALLSLLIPHFPECINRRFSAYIRVPQKGGNVMGGRASDLKLTRMLEKTKLLPELGVEPEIRGARPSMPATKPQVHLIHVLFLFRLLGWGDKSALDLLNVSYLLCKFLAIIIAKTHAISLSIFHRTEGGLKWFTFNDFLDYCVIKPYEQGGVQAQGIHWRPQYQIAFFCHLDYTFIGRLPLFVYLKIVSIRENSKFKFSSKIKLR